MLRPSIGIVVTLLLAFGGCKCTKKNSYKRPAYVGADALVDIAVLDFRGAPEGPRFRRARDCFAKRAGTEKMRHYPLREIGNFVQEDWCRGKGSEHNCAASSFRERAASAWRKVYTLHYDAEWPRVFGFGLSAGHNPAKDGWGVWFSYSKPTRGRIRSAGFGLSFVKYVKGKIDLQVSLSDEYSYTVERDRITLSTPGSVDEELGRLLASPESLRETAVARLGALLDKVVARLDAGKVTKCIYGKYNNDGIPPPCQPTALSPAEQKKLTADARALFGRRKQAVQDHYTALHAKLYELIDFKQCF